MESPIRETKETTIASGLGKAPNRQAEKQTLQRCWSK